MKIYRILCSLVFALLFSASGFSADEAKEKFDSVTIKDSYGKSRTPGEFKDSRFLVVAFLGTECPLAKLYGPRLQQLSEKFESSSVRVVGVCANIQDSLTEITAYANKAGIRFPMLLDNEQVLTDVLGARRTPEVFVLDEQRRIRYQGRIDDQYGIGVIRKAATTNDLEVAIQDLLNGIDPVVAKTPAVGCVIGRKKNIEPHGDVTYSKHIAPIFNQRCVECHRAGEIAPFPLTSYQDSIGWEATIAEVIREDRMPPWNANPEYGHFRNDSRLTAEEKTTILTWIENGCPEGDQADLPPTPSFVKGWRMPEPDKVIAIRDEPFTVPSTGVVEYQYFKVDPGFTEDVYVTAAEARPENPEVVHHIIAFLLVPGQENISLGKMLIGYAPGTSPLIFPDGAAMRVPAGSQILFELHYTPNGSEQIDRSYIGLKFTSADKVTREIVGLEALNERLQIPPGANSHVVTAEERFREDVTLLSLTPHMHLRGKAFRYDATYPDGTIETLLDVPKYDFNWQLRYEFSEPKLMPKGTVVKCTATFDNSADNPNNPDPTRKVTWGQQSFDEMMIGFFTGVRPLSE